MKNELLRMEILKLAENIKNDKMSELCRKMVMELRKKIRGRLSYVTECRRQVMTVEDIAENKIIKISFAKGKDKKYRVKDISVMEKEEKQ